jgi:hypothetical protein
MKSIKRLTSWHLLLFCLLTCLCAPLLRSARAQTGQKAAGKQTALQVGERLPGVPEGYTVIEGDIQVPTSSLKAISKDGEIGPQAAFEPTLLWPNGIVPFRFESNCAPTSSCTGAMPSGCVSTAKRAAMRAAMQILELVANVDFVECPNNTCEGSLGYHFVTIRDTSNDTTAGDENVCQSAAINNSAIGMQSSSQTINIASWDDDDQFIMVHELMHCLGFYHEHSHPKRDDYVIIHTKNVKSGKEEQFKPHEDASSYGYYDFDSVMHYSECSFSKYDDCPDASDAEAGGRTIEVKSPYNTQLSPDGVTIWQEAIGQRDHLSYLDRLTLSFLYPRADWRFVDQAYNGSKGAPNGSFQRPYTDVKIGIANTPAGGTLWIQPGTYAAASSTPYGKRITLQAPLGNVILR